jgi:hypothetical protein
VRAAGGLILGLALTELLVLLILVPYWDQGVMQHAVARHFGYDHA